MGDFWCTAFALQALSSQSPDGDDQAVADCEEAARLYECAGDEHMAARVIAQLGWWSLLEGEYERAEGFSLRSAALSEMLGDRPNALIAGNNAALALLLQGRIETAEDMLEKNVRGLQAVGLKRVAAEALCGLAGVAGARGDANRAATLLGAAEAAIEEADSPPSRVELRIAEHLLSRLGSDAFEVARREGRRLALPDAVGYALAETDEA